MRQQSSSFRNLIAKMLKSALCSFLARTDSGFCSHLGALAELDPLSEIFDFPKWHSLWYYGQWEGWQYQKLN